MYFRSCGNVRLLIQVFFKREYVFKIGIYFEKSSEIWPRHRHHNAQNYWSNGGAPSTSLRLYLPPFRNLIFTVISISKQMIEVVENVFALTIRVLTQTTEFFFHMLITQLGLSPSPIPKWPNYRKVVVPLRPFCIQFVNLIR